MRDYIVLDPTPIDEDCVQVGSENYRRRAIEEANRMIALLRQKFGLEPYGAQLGFKFVPYDGFNPGEVIEYLELRVVFDDNEPDAVRYANHIEEHFPLTWEDTTPVLFVPEQEQKEDPYAKYEEGL